MRDDNAQRGVVLFIYTCNIAISFMLAYQFAPILLFTQNFYDVDALLASFLVLVSSLIFLFVSVPVGSLIDKKGYIYSIRVGICLQIAFSFLRIAIESFWVELVAQIGIAASQPFIINSISKLVMDWFPPNEESIATGIGTIGIFIGTAIALITTPFLVDSIGYRSSMIFFSFLSVAPGVPFFVYPALRLSSINMDTSSPSGIPLKLLHNKQLLLLSFLSFLGLGLFNGIVTFLGSILGQHGLSETQSGVVGGLLILAGIIGTIVISLLSDWLGKRKLLLVGCITVAATFLTPLCVSSNYGMAIGFGMVLGFALLPALSLLLEMSALIVGKEMAGAATSMLMFAGNVGGVAVLLVMATVDGDLPSTIVVLMVIAGLGIIGTVLTQDYNDAVHNIDHMEAPP